MVADFVLRVLREGEPLSGLSGVFLEVVRDDTWWPRVNTCALDAFIHNCPDSKDKTSKLKALLTNIQSGSVSDPDNELLGILLFELYPQELPPSEVWSYLVEKGHRDHFYGMYQHFWETGLLRKSSDGQVAKLLDNLNDRLSVLDRVMESSGRLEHLPMKLLARGLKAHGDQLDKARLYDWLDVGLSGNQDGFWGSSKEATQEIRSWLEQRPQVWKAAFMEGLARCPDSDEFRFHAFNVRDRLYGASPPSELWSLVPEACHTHVRREADSC